MTLHVKDAGVWKEVTEPSVKSGGVWKSVQQMYVKDAGAWKLVFTAFSYSVAPGTYDPYAFSDYLLNIVASSPVTWTWTKTGTFTSVTPASGSISTSLTISLPRGTGQRAGSVTLSADNAGVTRNWQFNITVEGTA